MFLRKVMVPTDTYFKERGGVQPGLPEPFPQPAKDAMVRLAQTEGLTEFQQEILATVRDFIDKEIIPVATELEHLTSIPPRSSRG